MTGINIHSAEEAASFKPQRAQSIALAAVFILAGFGVTFSQQLHEELTFNVAIFTVFCALFAAVNLLFLKQSATGTTVFGVSLGVLALIAGVAALLISSVASFRAVVLFWAAATTLVLLLKWARTKLNNDLVMTLFFAFLTITLLFVAGSLPTVMGLFAAVCIVAGVYVGISAFDPPKKELNENETEKGYTA